MSRNGRSGKGVRQLVLRRADRPSRGSLSVMRTPVKVGSISHLGGSFPVFALVVARAGPRGTAAGGQGGAPAAQRGRTTLRPARIRRILMERVDGVKTLGVQAVGASRCSGRGAAVCGGACRRPALSGSTGDEPGDMMIDGVPGMPGRRGCGPRVPAPSLIWVHGRRAR